MSVLKKGIGRLKNNIKANKNCCISKVKIGQKLEAVNLLKRVKMDEASLTNMRTQLKKL